MVGFAEDSGVGSSSKSPLLRRILAKRQVPQTQRVRVVSDDLVVKGRMIERGTLGAVVQRNAGEWSVAFQGQNYNLKVPVGDTPKLGEIQRDELKPIGMLQAALRVGWFFDLWQTDRQRAVRCLQMPSSHPLRGLFTPPEDPNQSQMHRISTSFELKATMSAALHIEHPLWEQCGLPLAVWMVTANVVQLLFWVFLKDPCRSVSDQHGEQTHDCQFYSLVTTPGVGFALSGASFLMAYCCWKFWDAVCASVTAQCPEHMKKIRQLFVVNLWDKLALGAIHNVTGSSRKHTLLSGYVAMVLPYTIVALFMQDPGIFAFGQIVSGFFLGACNALLGESGSMKQVRMSDIQAIVTKCRNDAAIDITDVDLYSHVQQLLQHPPSHDTIVMDLRALVVFAGMIKGDCAESIRIRRFLIKGSFSCVSDAEEAFSMQQDQERWDGEITSVKDVIIDTYTETCTVVDGPQANARWERNGSPIPWHMAVRPDAAAATQFSLYALGMEPGSSAFSPGPIRMPHWENWEAQSWANKYFQLARESKAHVDKLSDTLTRMLRLPSFDDNNNAWIDALVAQGARVNDDQDHGGACRGLFFCIIKGNVNAAARLIELKANLQRTYVIDRVADHETPLQAAQRLGQDSIADMITRQLHGSV